MYTVHCTLYSHYILELVYTAITLQHELIHAAMIYKLVSIQLVIEIYNHNIITYKLGIDIQP